MPTAFSSCEASADSNSEEQPDLPILGAFIAGGFLFGPSSIVGEVPYDPELYFYGEEIAMSARLWTSGFNIYAPNRLLLFHLYKTEHTCLLYTSPSPRDRG